MYVQPPPDIDGLFDRLDVDRLRLVLNARAQSADDRYLHWDDVRHREPPAPLDREEWWLSLRLGRRGVERPSGLIGADGAPFTYGIPDIAFRLLHQVDQRCAGEIAMSEVVTAGEQARQHYLVNSLMEEAIRSSQLEGASTSRRVAKEMLRSGRAPRDRSEQMIINNFRALQFMRDRADEAIAPSQIIELQRMLTEGTLDEGAAGGRLQTPDEERVVVLDRVDGSVLHVPPSADELPGRLTALCDFANEDDDDHFVHPVVRSILLHLWLAHDHPFEDGNGRTARTLLYWSMARRGYWLVEYLSISKILRKAPGAYNRALLLTETDGNDATYFLLHQLGVIEQAVDELHGYLRRKVRDVQDVERLVRNSDAFNHRELALLGDAVRDPSSTYTYAAHARSHGVTHETARVDLLHLARLGLLVQQGRRRPHAYHPPDDLTDRLRALDPEG